MTCNVSSGTLSIYSLTHHTNLPTLSLDNEAITFPCASSSLSTASSCSSHLCKSVKRCRRQQCNSSVCLSALMNNCLHAITGYLSHNRLEAPVRRNEPTLRAGLSADPQSPSKKQMQEAAVSTSGFSWDTHGRGAVPVQSHQVLTTGFSRYPFVL